ncbi:MAG: 2'-5' RNA ligase family protein [Actinomycetota bacterium]
MSRAELILYATPTGPLADALVDRFAILAERSPTTAQTYPPHCTLTGFFHRDHDAVDRIVAEFADLDADVAPATAVTVDRLRVSDEWVGLEISSPWLLDVTERFLAGHVLAAGDDALRPKDWLHLSIAYGEGDLTTAAALCADLDPDLPSGWRVGLWERRQDGSWRDLSR